MGFKDVRHLHDNAPAHTSVIVTIFFAEREGNSFTTPSLFTWSFPLWLLPLFLKLKTFLAGRRYQARHAIVSAVYQYLTRMPESAYHDVFRKSIYRLKLPISSHGDYFYGHEIKNLWLLIFWTFPVKLSNSFRTPLVYWVYINRCYNVSHSSTGFKIGNIMY